MAGREADRRFEYAVEDILPATWEFYPNLASGLGLHEYDGRLSDISGASLARRSRQLRDALDSLEAIDPAGLSRQDSFDHRMLTAALKRDYAPLEQRVETLTRALEAVPKVVDGLKGVLGARLSRAVLEASIEAYSGVASFYDNDLPEAVEPVDDPHLRLREKLEEARRSASEAITAFVEHLKALREHAVDDFAIGPEGFRRLLEQGEMVDLPMQRLLDVGSEDLARNLARFRHTAARIDPSRSPAEVMVEVAGDHPTAGSLMSDTSDMLEELRTFLIDHHIVSVPSEDRCQTTETPTYMLWAFAAMDMPGPFETSAREAYYYVTPVEDGWTERQKEEWLTSFNYASLQNISVHEAYPGHYVHYLHTRSAPSKISQVFGAYSFCEGWGHYTEEMMIEQGLAGDDPRVVLGQLSDALLRNCRYVCAIRMHTQGMTVEEATRFFMENAYMKELPAGKEAMRGTFDPMYLNYCLGKLMILKLREDFQAEKGVQFSLKEFHDTFLSFGAPPIPLVREMMLREPGKDVL